MKKFEFLLLTAVSRKLESGALNVSNEANNLTTETAVALAAPAINATLMQLNEENHETVVRQARVINQHDITRNI